MKLRRLLLLPILLLLFTVAGQAQTWNSFPFNGANWNGSASVSRAFNQTDLTSSGTSITGFHAVDPLSVGLTVTSGVTLDLIISATYEVKVNQSDTSDVVSLAVDPSGGDGIITNQGDGITAGYALFFNQPGSSLTSGRTYFYKISVLDTAGHTAVYSGTIRML